MRVVDASRNLDHNREGPPGPRWLPGIGSENEHRHRDNLEDAGHGHEGHGGDAAGSDH
jgi:hypothetical protein